MANLCHLITILYCLLCLGPIPSIADAVIQSLQILYYQCSAWNQVFCSAEGVCAQCHADSAGQGGQQRGAAAGQRCAAAAPLARPHSSRHPGRRLLSLWNPPCGVLCPWYHPYLPPHPPRSASYMRSHSQTECAALKLSQSLAQGQLLNARVQSPCMKARPPVHSVAQVQAWAVLEERKACCCRRVWECASAPSSSPAGSQQRAGAAQSCPAGCRGPRAPPGPPQWRHSRLICGRCSRQPVQWECRCMVRLMRLSGPPEASP